MSKKNLRCPLQDTCEKICKYENRENECQFYRNNCLPGDEIEGQPINVGTGLSLDDELDELAQKEKAALELDAKIKIHANLAWQNLMESAKCLKEMRDTKLYLELGYSSFEEYTQESLNIKQRQAYTYIKAYEDLGERFLHLNASLGITKLGLLAQIPATVRDEFVEENDLSTMSVEEVKKLVAENDAKGEQIDMLTEECEDLKTEKDDLQKAHNEAVNERDDLKDGISAAEKEIARLKAELVEERNKPTEFAVVEPDEATLNKIRDEAAKAAKAEAEKQFKADKKALKDKLTAEKEKAVADATEKVNKELEDYKAKLAVLDAEKAAMLKRAEELEKQLAISSSPETVMFTFYFEALQNDHKKLFESITTIRKENPEVAKQYHGALIKFYVGLEETIRGL